MKSGIAGVLIVLGLGLLVTSQLGARKVSAADEWSEEKMEKFSQITANVHSPQRDPDAAAAEIKELQDMQREIVDYAEKKKGSAKIRWWSGLVLAVVGICFQLWAWTDKKD